MFYVTIYLFSPQSIYLFIQVREAWAPGPEYATKYTRDSTSTTTSQHSDNSNLNLLNNNNSRAAAAITTSADGGSSCSSSVRAGSATQSHATRAGRSQERGPGRGEQRGSSAPRRRAVAGGAQEGGGGGMGGDKALKRRSYHPQDGLSQVGIYG